MRCGVLAVLFFGFGCTQQPQSEQPADVVVRPSSVSDDGTVWTFRENVSPEEWGELSMQIASAERIEFVDSGQEPLSFAVFEDADALKVFRFDGQFDRAELGAICQCHSLRRLNLANSNLTDADLGQLAGLTDLRSLRLGAPEMSDAVLEATANHWPKLTHLHLIRVSLTDAGLTHLDDARTLESFYLDDVSISGDALRSLVERRPDLHIHVNELHLDE